MGKTIRNIRKGYKLEYISKGGDAQVDHSSGIHRKMKPYALTPSVSKFTASKTCYTNGYQKGVSRTDKIQTKNANRSFKKALRQKYKKEIMEILITI